MSRSQSCRRAQQLDLAQCMFGAPYQKYTTFMYSPGISRHLDPLDGIRCTHASHEKIAGGTVDEAEVGARFERLVAPSLQLAARLDARRSSIGALGPGMRAGGVA